MGRKSVWKGQSKLKRRYGGNTTEVLLRWHYCEWLVMEISGVLLFIRGGGGGRRIIHLRQDQRSAR